MKDRVKTLLIQANGATWKSVLADTVLRGLFRVPAVLTADRFPQRRMMQRLFGVRNDSLSYVLDWQEALCDSDRLDVDLCNMSNLVDYMRCLRALHRYGIIILLHSATGDNMSILLKTAESFKKRRGSLVVFVGNEYNFLADKIRFICSVEADHVCSQLPSEAASWLYQDCQKSKILPMPHALNPRLYYPDPAMKRTTDLGFIGQLYHEVIGDRERSELIQFFEKSGKRVGLDCEIRTERVPRAEWAHFLRRCRGTLGAESGTYYLDRTGNAIEGVRRYLKKRPGAAFDELFDKFFKGACSPVSGKAVSSRHFEPVGTKTCQILIEGKYNDILKADEHYLAVKKDLSNMDEVVRRFKDETFRTSMAEATYEYVMSSHTYKHRVEALLKTVLDNIPKA
jgi:hypothetical protein